MDYVINAPESSKVVTMIFTEETKAVSGGKVIWEKAI